MDKVYKIINPKAKNLFAIIVIINLVALWYFNLSSKEHSHNYADNYHSHSDYADNNHNHQFDYWINDHSHSEYDIDLDECFSCGNLYDGYSCPVCKYKHTHSLY